MARRTIPGSRAIVTGASSGIGREIALELGRHSADVVLVARNEEALRKVADEFAALPGRAEFVVGDITHNDVRHAAVERAVATFGGLDILVNNAGIGALGRFEQSDGDRMRRIMEVNFFAAAEMIHAALPVLRNGRNPIVVNVGSILGHRGIPHMSEYCASKFALRGLSEAIRTEFAALGIDVLLVSPGTTETEFHQHGLSTATAGPWPKQQGVPASDVARETVAAIAAGRKEIIPSRRGRMLCWLQRFAPWMLDREMRKYA